LVTGNPRVPYTSYSVSKLPSSNIPQLSEVITVTGPVASRTLTEPEEKTLEKIPRLVPLLRESNWAFSGNTALESMDSKALVDLCQNLQEHYKKTSFAISNQQKAIMNQIKETAIHGNRVVNQLSIHNANLKTVSSHFREVERLTDQISRCNQLVSNIVLACQRLNSVLPPQQRLSDISLSPIPLNSNAKQHPTLPQHQQVLTRERHIAPATGEWEWRIRSGASAEQGKRPTMEDVHVAIDDLTTTLPPYDFLDFGPTARNGFYAVYDGHGGQESALLAGKLFHLYLFHTIQEDCDLLKNDSSKTNQPILEIDGTHPEQTPTKYDKEKTTENKKAPTLQDYSQIILAGMTTAFALTDSQILSRGNELNLKDGTTAVVALVLGNLLFVANLGDSEAVLASLIPNSNSSNSKPKPSYSISSILQTSSEEEGSLLKSIVLTKKHKPTDEEERKRIEELGGKVILGRVEGILAVSRALGDPEFKFPNKLVSTEPYVLKYELTENDKFMILACDGVWDYVSYDEAVGIVARGRKEKKSPQEVSQTLVQTALHKGSKDNLSVIVVYFGSD